MARTFPCGKRARIATMLLFRVMTRARTLTTFIGKFHCIPEVSIISCSDIVIAVVSMDETPLDLDMSSFLVVISFIENVL